MFWVVCWFRFPTTWQIDKIQHLQLINSYFSALEKLIFYPVLYSYFRSILQFSENNFIFYIF